MHLGGPRALAQTRTRAARSDPHTQCDWTGSHTEFRGCVRVFAGSFLSRGPELETTPPHPASKSFESSSAGCVRRDTPYPAGDCGLQACIFLGPKACFSRPGKVRSTPLFFFSFFRNDTPPNEWHRGAAAHQLTTDQVVSLANNFLPALPSSRLSVCPRRPTT